MKQQTKGVFSENFVRIDTDDGVAGVMILKRRKGEIIDLSDRNNSIEIRSKEEAEEIIKLIQEGMAYL